jgi:hypothetical protein
VAIDFNISGKDLWGFSIKFTGLDGKRVKKYSCDVVKKIVDQAYENAWEFHFIPQVRCLFIKTDNEIWHYLPSEKEACDFQNNLVFSKHYPSCYMN